jgi:hypothetical protein
MSLARKDNHKVTINCSPAFRTALNTLLAATSYTTERGQTRCKQGLSHFINELLSKGAIYVKKLNTGEYEAIPRNLKTGNGSNLKQIRDLAAGHTVSQKGVSVEVTDLFKQLLDQVQKANAIRTKSEIIEVDNVQLHSTVIDELIETLVEEQRSKDFSSSLTFEVTPANSALLKSLKTNTEGNREILVDKLVDAKLVKIVMQKDDAYKSELYRIYSNINDQLKQIHITKLEGGSYHIELAKLIAVSTSALKKLVQSHASKN